MDPHSLSLMSVAVGILARLALAAGVRGKWSSLASVVLSALVLVIWGVDAGDFSRDMVWEYFEAFLQINVTAAGVFHLIEEGEKARAVARE